MKFMLKVLMILLTITSGFQIKPITSKKIPKVSHTKIHDISYKSPIRVRRMEPFAFRLVKEMANTINVYINETYAMASFPLSYTFSTFTNITNLD